MGNYYSLKGGISIPPGADLKSDTYKVPGNYYCEFTQTARTLVNCPCDFAFILKVEYCNGLLYPMQTFISLFNENRIIRRMFDDSTSTWTQDTYYATNSGINTFLEQIQIKTTRDEKIKLISNDSDNYFLIGIYDSSNNLLSNLGYLGTKGWCIDDRDNNIITNYILQKHYPRTLQFGIETGSYKIIKEQGTERFSQLLFLQAANKDGYGLFLISGYGEGGPNRYNIIKIASGELYKIELDTKSIKIINNVPSASLAILVSFSGDTPIIV